jgi:hypothetical protein
MDGFCHNRPNGSGLTYLFLRPHPPLRELAGVVEGAQYPVSPRIQTLRAIPAGSARAGADALASAEVLRAAQEGEVSEEGVKTRNELHQKC